MLILLMGTHIFMSFKTGFIQRKLPAAIRLSVKKEDENAKGTSQFAGLAASLAATVGTGNILGVATAIILGGPGAVFWIWISGIFAMATKYAETLIGVSYREEDENKNRHGGAMYVLKNALHSKFLARLFALLALLSALGLGCSLQANAMAGVIIKSLPNINAFAVRLALAAVLTALTALVILGGVGKVMRICELTVPIMAAVYFLGCIAILYINRAYLVQSVLLIISSAFNKTSVISGFAGTGFICACRYGVSRGLFSNEAGTGTSPIIAATARNNNAAEVALVASGATFWDTVVICLLTGITMVSSIAANGVCPQSGEELAIMTFNTLPTGGAVFLAAMLSVFAFSTILGWCVFGEESCYFLFGSKACRPFRFVWLAAVFCSVFISSELLWNLTDIINALMVLPNILCLIMLSGEIQRQTKGYVQTLSKNFSYKK